jgi:hypothetical protein
MTVDVWADLADQGPLRTPTRNADPQRGALAEAIPAGYRHLVASIASLGTDSDRPTAESDAAVA